MAMSPRFLRPRSGGLDRDAATYMNAVAAADGQQLEAAVKKAINDFVIGCKRDGIWSALKASCILMGARTLSGALTPLVGVAPTNTNFVSGDYNRKTGLVGNGSTKFLNSNRNGNVDPQDNAHIAVYASSTVTSVQGYFGSGLSAVGSSNSFPNGGGGVSFRSRSNASDTISGVASTAGLVGVSRSASGSFVARAGGTSATISLSSQTPVNADIHLFALNNSGASFHSAARLAFYSIGESLSLAALDSRVAALYSAIGAAIP